MPENVTLHIYDLSQGFAKQLSMSIMQKQFDAVYHTGVVLFNTEYFYGGGIYTGTPAYTPYGVPIERRELGSTEKSVYEIYDWIRANKGTFSESAYNPMTHNCNHFSKAFCEFLGIGGFPDEILRQPEEFMGTGIGQLMSGILGFKPSNSTTPQPQQRSETVNKNFASLFIQYPKMYVAEDEELIREISAVAADYQTVYNLNGILSAYNQSMNYKTQCYLKNEVSASFFDVLALISTTSSVETISQSNYPFNYERDVMETDDSLLVIAFLRYLNNFIAEPVGMRDAREKHTIYLRILRGKLASADQNVRLGALRALFTFSRILTLRIEKIENVTAIFFVEAPKYLTMSNKPEIASLNLICGGIGRCMITIAKENSYLANELRIKAVNLFSGKGFKESKAPCIRDLSVYLKLDGEAEEFY